MADNYDIHDGAMNGDNSEHYIAINTNYTTYTIVRYIYLFFDSFIVLAVRTIMI